MSSAPPAGYSQAEILVTDYSPLITYTGDWRWCWDQLGCSAASPGQVGVGEPYHTAAASSAENYLELTFSGDVIHMYGNYSQPSTSITVDGTPAQYYTPQGNFNHLMAGSNLNSTSSHFLSLQTTGVLDFVHFEVYLDSPQPLYNYTLQYWDPAIQYSTHWAPATLGGTTLAQTSTTGASASVNFTGTGVIVYSALDEHNGPYTVTLDGQTTRYTPFTGSQWTTPPDAVIYYILGLQPGQHQLLLTNKPHPSGAGNTTLTLSNITFIQHASEAVLSTASPTLTNTAVTSLPTGPPTSSLLNGSSSHVGAIAGGVIGGLALLTLLALAGWFFWRRRKAQREAAPFFGPLDLAAGDPPRGDEKHLPASGPSSVSLLNPNPARPGATPHASSSSSPYLPPHINNPSPQAGPPHVVDKRAELAVTHALAGAGVHADASREMLDGPDSRAEVVDRMLEMLVERIGAPGSAAGGSEAGGTLPPPRYEERR